MLTALRASFCVICLLTLTAWVSQPVRAEDSAAPAAAAAASSSAAQDAEMPGCPGKANGGACCGTCQEKAAQQAAAPAGAAPAGVGCPCQRARQAKQAAAAAAQ